MPTDWVENRVTGCDASSVATIPPLAATRMKRCPVLLHLALLAVALFADDAKYIVDLPSSGKLESAATVVADTSTTQTAIRLLDAEGSLVEIARGGRSVRDGLANHFPEVLSPQSAVYSGAAVNIRQPFPATSSLISQHTRLQV